MTRISGLVERHRALYRIFVVALIVVAVFILGWQGGEDYVTNIYTELFGVVISAGVTVIIVDRVYERRDEQRLKQRLFREVGSGSNEFAKNAVSRLRAEGWLVGKDGLLLGANLHKANLQGVNLNGANLADASLMAANLQQASLESANLQDAELGVANLEQAELSFANLQAANMIHVNLSGAFLLDADLQQTKLQGALLQGSFLVNVNLQGARLDGARLLGATLQGANLQGADLRMTNLAGAALEDANLDNTNLSDAILPDRSKYSAHTEMARFTDTKHPDFESTKELVAAIAKTLPREMVPNIHVSFPLQ